MNDIAIWTENIGKRYRIGERVRYKALRDTLTDVLYAPFRGIRSAFQSSKGRHTAEDNTFWALKDISFEVRHGEVVGIVGRNGAGKSTLLKILSRITEPTSGRAIVRGRVGTLLEVGTGFHPELTGRENIYLNGTILGMKKVEIDRKFDAIVDFAEVEQFIDMPVKHFSSGMHVRLAFAVAAHLEPEILLVDEVLAVGDAVFQNKCLGKMSDVAKEGRTVLFVSHNMAAVARLCGRGILLEKGHMTYVGPVEHAIQRYQMAAAHETVGIIKTFESRTGSGKIRFKEVAVLNEHGDPWLYSGGTAQIKMVLEVTTSSRAANLTIGIGVNGSYGDRLITLLNKFDPQAHSSDRVIVTDTVVTCTIPRLPLRPGTYYLSLYIDINGEISDRIKDALRIDIQEADFYGTGLLPTARQGPFLVEQIWRYDTP